MNSIPNTAQIVLVPFHGDELQTLLTSDGKAWVVFRPVCKAIGLDYSAQLKRLTKPDKPSWSNVATTMAVARDQKRRKVIVIDLDCFHAWLATVKIYLISAAAKDKLAVYQQDCARVLRERLLGETRDDEAIAVAAIAAAKRARHVQHILAEIDKRVTEIRELLDNLDASNVRATPLGGQRTPASANPFSMMW